LAGRQYAEGPRAGAFLPESADSTLANNLIDESFGDGRKVDALVVYFREGG